MLEQRVEEIAVLVELVDEVLPVDVGARVVDELDELPARLPRTDPVRLDAFDDDEVAVLSNPWTRQ